jgi:short-subunit dehydrogenase
MAEPRVTRSRRPAKTCFSLSGAVCLVTGASRGIGAATARRLAEAGGRLVLQGRDEEALRRVARETRGSPIVLDFAEPGAVDRLVDEALRRAGRIDVLVNNAGAGWAGRFAQMPPGQIESLVALNLLAPLEMARAVLPGMLTSRRGSIVLVSSIAGYLGVRDEAVYSATKAGLLAFGESLRAETAGTGVGVSVVSPVVVQTDFFARRGRPYGRTWPPPVSADVVARSIRDAIVFGRPEVIVGSGMRVSVGVRTVFPSLYRRLADRFA